MRKLRRHPQRFLSESRMAALQVVGKYIGARPGLEERIRNIMYAPQDYLPGFAAFSRPSIRKLRAALTLDVIIPCHNNADTLEAAIQSILRQTYPVTNIIVVDDASTDLCRNIVSRLAEMDSRIQLYTIRDNQGVAYARNLGLKQARSRIVAFQDADDVSHPKRFECQIRHLQRFDSIAVTCDGCRVAERKVVEVDGHYYHELSVSVLFRREEVLQSIGFIRGMTIGEDVDYLSRMKAAFGEERILHIPRCLYFAAMRAGSAIHAHGEVREVGPGRYIYVPSGDTQTVLDGIPSRNRNPDNLFVPFMEAETQAQIERCGR